MKRADELSLIPPALYIRDSRRNVPMGTPGWPEQTANTQAEKASRNEPKT